MEILEFKKSLNIGLTDSLNSNISVTYKDIKFIFFVLKNSISGFDFQAKNVYLFIVTEISKTLFSVIRDGGLLTPVSPSGMNKITLSVFA